MVHANVQSDAGLADGRSYRLVVQSYDDPGASPVGSTQRPVTAAELRAGVRVGLLELRQARPVSDSLEGVSHATPVVVAWVEEGKADLELDGLRARPRPGSLRGTAPRTSADAVQISVQVEVA